MKLISFNIWGGTIYEPLMEYIKQQSADTDIFCFQEVFSSLPGAPRVSSGARMFLFQELQALLPNFHSFFDLRSSHYDFEGYVEAPVSHGLAVFVNKALEVASVDSKLLAIVEPQADHFIKAQILRVEADGKQLELINFHGLSRPGDKQDTPERLDQSRQLKQIWQGLKTSAKILCGDFNLYPETESVKILETCGKNLIKDWHITNTRNQVSWQRPDNTKQTFADYIFVSNEVQVKNFQVPYNEISDHLPMILEFEIK